MNVKLNAYVSLQGHGMKKYFILVVSLLWATETMAQSPALPLNLDPNGETPSAIQPPAKTSAPLIDLSDDSEDYPDIETKQSLTENFKNNAPDNTETSDDDQNGSSWVGQLISNIKTEDSQTDSAPNPLTAVLEESVSKPQRSNASVFDISGVMLRMSYAQAEAALLKRGYRKTTQKLDIPNFIRWRNEDSCRNQGVVGYERLNSCVIKLARENKYEYVQQAQFNKYDTQETVNFYLTSTFTNNKVYKITYRTEAANNAGNSQKAIYLRNIKVYDFWKKINQKYGVPDNKDEAIWSLGQNKPYLKASTGLLTLEDPMLRELDYTRMSREDQRFMNTDLYTF